MKTIIIQVVQNGYLVNNWESPMRNCSSDQDIHVYRSIAELQSDLPKLLDEPTQFLPTLPRNAVPISKSDPK